MIDAICKDYLKRSGRRQTSILEIGCFVGTSTLVWGNALKNSRINDWRITCCDMWHHFGDKKYEHDKTIIGSYRNSFNHEIFKFNVQKAIGFDHITEVIGDSRKSLPSLRDSYFDIVYVDGYHGYSVSSSDIKEAMRLCRPGGIVCGDDYDCTPEMLSNIPMVEREEDDQMLDGYGVHAGVVQAVDELLGKPICFGPFWAFEKQDECFSAVDVTALPREIPSLLSSHRERFEALLNSPNGMSVGHPFANRGEQVKAGKPASRLPGFLRL